MTTEGRAPWVAPEITFLAMLDSSLSGAVNTQNEVTTTCGAFGYYSPSAN